MLRPALGAGKALLLPRRSDGRRFGVKTAQISDLRRH
jgi:hypothetical protein